MLPKVKKPYVIYLAEIIYKDIANIKNALASIIGLSIPSLILSLALAADMVSSIMESPPLEQPPADPAFGYEF